jgi:hypothetical protein
MIDRHADKETLEHIVDLRRRLADAERERDNALAFLKVKDLSRLKRYEDALQQIYWTTKCPIAAKALEGCSDGN